MSRIGRQAINIPSGVDIKIDGQKIMVKGPKGELSMLLSREIKVVQKENTLIFEKHSSSKKAQAMHGLYRSLVYNMCLGVTEGFSKELELVGTGYRVKQDGKNIILSLGFSHPVNFQAPDGIDIKIEGEKNIKITGIDKNLVGQIAAKLKSIRKPEPYKGKGIRYKGETIKLKAGKQVKSAS